TIERRKPDGTLVQGLYIGHNDNLGGLALDQTGRLLVTDASAQQDSSSPNAVYFFDQNGNPSPFGTDSTAASSIAFARHGQAFTGGGAGIPQILQYAADASVLTSFFPTIQANTINWIDLASDQCAVYYTYGPALIKRYDVCAKADGSDFAAFPGETAHDLRIRSNGEVVLAADDEVLVFNADGSIRLPIGTRLSLSYNALALDPDGSSVWVGDRTGQIFHFDLTNGAQIGKTIATNFTSVHGLAIVGEQRAGTLGPNCSLSVAPNPGVAFIAETATGNCTAAASATLDFGDNTPVLNTASGTHSYAAAGRYVVTLTGTDANGLSDTATQTVSIGTNQPPTCVLSVVPTSGPAPLGVTATGSCTDPENDITGTTLDFGDGTVMNASSGTHTYAAAGTYTVTLTATDAAGNKATATQSITVAVNQPPTCTLSVVPTSGFAPLSVTITGSCTDPEQALTSTLLDFGDGTTQSAASGTHTYANPGTFTVKLTGTDAVGQKGSATQAVTVNLNTAPICTLAVTPGIGQAPLPITATGSCTDAENNIKTTVLDFGDGTSVNASSGSHTFAQAGTFTVKITATDALGLAGSASQTVTVSSFPTGIFVGVAGGKVMQFATDGTLQRTMDTGLGGTVSGMAFDSAGNLYATDFTAGNISKFDPKTGTLLGTFGSGFNCQPETIVFDGAGNAYVGQQGCSRTILKFDPSGKLAATFQVRTENQGGDDVDLSADQCTLLYTSEGASVLRYDVCHNQQLGPFATGLKKALVVRILPDGGAIVGDLTDIIRLNSIGQTVTTYTASGEQCLYAITLDADGTSFWAGDYCSSNIYRFDIASGRQLTKFNTGTPTGTVFGIAVAGTGLNVSGLGNAGKVTASPQSATIAAGQSVTFTLSFAANAASAGRTLTLSCAGLPVGLSCSFSPSTITLGAAGTTTTVTLTITRTVTAARFDSRPPWELATWMVGAVPAIAFAGIRVRRNGGAKLWLAAILLGAGLCSSCGGNGGMGQSTAPSTTPQGTYTVIVAGTGTGLQTSTTVNVTVQ
ncbi:MAG TPA: PKD domain-containing protein, partial [Terriglobales bacterium]|nr:PKD domain-containing protein [Terriglobales bacterium]